MNKCSRLSIVIGILLFAFNVLPAHANTNSSNSSGANNSNSSGTNNSNGSGTNNSNGSGSNP
ncbi:MAG: hypothetical protein H0X31_19270, partial [Nostocaceae cyanobacterium]|nr:hypothetical protein [Nostocaceae cyanobacterium]